MKSLSALRALSGLIAAAWLVQAAPASAAPRTPASRAPKTAKTTKAVKVPTVQEVLASSSVGDWRALDPDNTLLMKLQTPQGAGQVIIELAPRFAPAHAANIRALVHGHYYDGLSILRVQDNFVTQWGDPDGDDAGKARKLPEGAVAKLPAEFSVPLASIGRDAGYAKLPELDGWAPRNGFAGGMPVAADPGTGRAWLAHCYGMVGAGRGDAVDSSTGAELYAVIGHAPRALDLNITVVGRVLQGMELLSGLPRGGAAMGFYDKPEQRIAIQSVRLLADLPVEERPSLQVLKTESPTWTAVLEARRHRKGWYVHSPDRVDLCSASVPTRPAP